MKLPHWFSAPAEIIGIQRNNFRYVQIDAIGIGLANVAGNFLPIFLTRLGATNFQVGLLNSMPAVTGLLLAIFICRYLQTRHKIVPWFSGARLLVVSCFALTGIVPFFVSQQNAVVAILIVWAVATLPQIVLNVSFSVVMNAVAGPTHRYELMSRRWSLLGLTSAIVAIIVGQLLDRLSFPRNYQLIFIGLTFGGVISYIFSSRIELPDLSPPVSSTHRTFREQFRDYFNLVFSQRPFVSFILKRLVFITGVNLAGPLFPLYFVREVKATDSWIGIINFAQMFIMVFGYFFWVAQSRRRGSRFVLLCTTLGLALYPALIASTENLWLITILAGSASILQTGIDLVFFDELMKTVPIEYSATFVSFAQSLHYLSLMAAPLIGTALATPLGLGGALLVSAGIRMIGFLLFMIRRPRQQTSG